MPVFYDFFFPFRKARLQASRPVSCLSVLLMLCPTLLQAASTHSVGVGSLCNMGT